jgi:hypothetical protein
VELLSRINWKQNDKLNGKFQYSSILQQSSVQRSKAGKHTIGSKRARRLTGADSRLS